MFDMCNINYDFYSSESHLRAFLSVIIDLNIFFISKHSREIYKTSICYPIAFNLTVPHIFKAGFLPTPSAS